MLRVVSALILVENQQDVGLVAAVLGRATARSLVMGIRDRGVS